MSKPRESSLAEAVGKSLGKALQDMVIGPINDIIFPQHDAGLRSSRYDGLPVETQGSPVLAERMLHQATLAPRIKMQLTPALDA